MSCTPAVDPGSTDAERFTCRLGTHLLGKVESGFHQPTRRRFTAEYKQHILKSADACTETGDLGALLRREGLYASTLAYWRRQRDKGTLSALNPKKRGRKAYEQTPLIREAEKLRKENERLKERLRKAELIIDVQKKES